MGVAGRDVVRCIGQHGLRYRARGWSMGMSILTALGDVLPALAAEDRPLALAAWRRPRGRGYGGSGTPLRPRAIAGNAGIHVQIEDVVPSRDRGPRPGWRAERVLQTAIAAQASSTVLADMLLVAATDHVYLDAGHIVDFINKACEYLDVVGWDSASLVLPSLVESLAHAQRSEEQNAWRNPIDLIDLLGPHLDRLASLSPGEAPLDGDFDALVSAVLQDDPGVGLESISAALERGVAFAEIGQAVAHAAVLRIGRFHTSNEFADWDAVHNTWTAAQALARALQRAPSPLLARGLYHQALRVYLDRFLNIPAARLPDERPDRRAQSKKRRVRCSDCSIASSRWPRPRCWPIASSPGARRSRSSRSWDTRSFARTPDSTRTRRSRRRIRQFDALHERNPLAARRTLVSVTRYVAAHAPTSRALFQTYRIAERLLRGDDLTLAADE